MSTMPARDDVIDVIRDTPEAIAILQQNGIVGYVSPTVTALLGYMVRDLKGKSAFSLIHPLDLAGVLQIFSEAVIHPHHPYKKRIRAKKKDGTWIDLACSAQYIPDEPICGMLVRAQDVSAMLEAEKRVQSSLEQLHKLSRAVEQSPDSVVITTREGSIEYVNPAFERVTGYTSAEAIGQNPRILQSGKTPLSVYKDMWDTLLSGHTWHGELLNKKKNGELYWESATFSPVIDEQGTITNFLAIKKEITKEKEIAQKLLASERQFQKVIETITNGIIIHDQDGNVLTANPAAQETLGQSLDQLRGKGMDCSSGTIIHEDGSPYTSETFPVTITAKTGISQKNIVIGVKRHDGSIAWLLVSTVVSGTDEMTNLPKGIITSFTDITAMRNAAEAIRQKTTDLERMNKLMIGRELKMIELKARITSLEHPE